MQSKNSSHEVWNFHDINVLELKKDSWVSIVNTIRYKIVHPNKKFKNVTCQIRYGKKVFLIRNLGVAKTANISETAWPRARRDRGWGQSLFVAGNPFSFNKQTSTAFWACGRGWSLFVAGDPFLFVAVAVARPHGHGLANINSFRYAPQFLLQNLSVSGG